MATEYRVIFAGAVLAGFELDAVKQTAGARLKASPEQVNRLFSGCSAVLKKGLSHELGERYIAELRRIGMVVELVAEVPAAPVMVIEPVTLAAQPAAVPARHAAAIASNDLEKTQIANPEALARYLRDDIDPSSAPTLIVPRSQVTEYSRQTGTQDPSSMPTFIVPRTQLEETRRQIQQALSDHDDPSNAPTLIVPRSGTAKSGVSATVITGQGADHLRVSPTAANKKHDPERTLIANEGALEAYLAANAGSSPMGNMTSTDITPANTLPGHEVPQSPEPVVTKTTPPGSIRARRTESLANVMELDLPATPANSAPQISPMRPFQAQMPHDETAETAETGYSGNDTHGNPDSKTNSNRRGTSSSNRLLLLAALGAACLLALIVWLTM